MPVLQLGHWVTRRVTCPRTGGGGLRQSQEWQPACLRFSTLPTGYLPEEQTSPSCWKQPMETFPSTLPNCLFLLILQSQFHPSSPFLLAALPCELPHLAGSTSWLPVRQLVTSFSLKPPGNLFTSAWLLPSILWDTTLGDNVLRAATRQTGKFSNCCQSQTLLPTLSVLHCICLGSSEVKQQANEGDWAQNFQKWGCDAQHLHQRLHQGKWWLHTQFQCHQE